MGNDTPVDAAIDAALIARIVAGSEDALVSLYRRRRRDVYVFALAMGKSAAFAEDTTHDVFLNVIENAARFDAAKGSVQAWLLGCARHVVIDHLRRQKRWTFEVPEQAVADDADEQMLASQRSRQLHAAIAVLPVEYREALVLCELHGLSYAETASVLKCPVGTVRSRLHRARAMLTAALGPREPEAPAGAALPANLNRGEACP